MFQSSWNNVYVPSQKLANVMNDKCSEKVTFYVCVKSFKYSLKRQKNNIQYNLSYFEHF